MILELLKSFPQEGYMLGLKLNVIFYVLVSFRVLEIF